MGRDKVKIKSISSSSLKGKRKKPKKPVSKSTDKVAGSRKITEEEKGKRLAARDEFLKNVMCANGFLNVRQLKIKHLTQILQNLGCRGNSVSENMVKKKLQEGNEISCAKLRTLHSFQAGS